MLLFDKANNVAIVLAIKLNFGVIKNEEAEVEKFCNNESCELPGLNVEEN